jgi:2-oxoisovalerate dehydrogenase E1 component
MFMLGVMSIQEFFAQLYAHADVTYDPASAGRQMNAHFASRNLYPNGSWRPQTQMYNTASDISPTAAQMPRSVGLGVCVGHLSQGQELQDQKDFSNNGNEIAFATIGNASTSEGLFWESVNAIGVLKAPAIVTIYDDGYGISVPNQFQMVKENIGTLLKGFERNPNLPFEKVQNGYDHYTVHAWDYPALVETYLSAAEIAREYHIPALVHVIDVTQPQVTAHRAVTSDTNPQSDSSGKRNSTASKRCAPG